MFPPGPVKNLITSLRAVHDENFGAEHYYRFSSHEKSSMYLTPFIYQYFVYNSLYQINWEESFCRNSLVPLTERDDRKMQSAFESFLFQRTTCPAIVSSFREIPRLTGDEEWIEVAPDAEITAERGKHFFANLRAFQAKLRRVEKSKTDPLLKEALGYVPQLRLFVYDVRCNIFHGRKSLAEAREYGQNKRVQVYYLFLNGLVRLFFSACSRRPPGITTEASLT